MELENLKDDFFVTDENVEDLVKGFSVNILWALEDYRDYYKVIIGIEPTPKQEYVFCLMLEQLSR